MSVGPNKYSGLRYSLNRFSLSRKVKYLERDGIVTKKITITIVGPFGNAGKYASSVGLIGNADSSRNYYVPLMFWFNRNPGLSLPLIALQYHEVKVVLEFRHAAELIVGLTATGDRDFDSNTTSIRDSAGVSLVNAALYVDYVYLDTKNLWCEKYSANDMLDLSFGKQLVSNSLITMCI